MKKNLILIVIIIIVSLSFLLIFLFVPKKKMIDLSNKNITEVEQYALNNKLDLEIKKINSSILKDYVINQSIPKDTIIKKKMKLLVTISLGLDYKALKVNELGNIPIMMYHGVRDEESKFIGGNIDKAGYQRTKKAFINDLESYYKKGYRMIKLNDYVNGLIDVKEGLSPIILTFDDGLENNIKVNGLDEAGNIIIDPNSVVGILESFKQKYPDFNVTATFFVNGGMFNQSKYNEKILKWLINNNYDIGNHSYSHADFTKINEEKAVSEIGLVYNLLDKYIPNKYVKIVALPFGSPYNKNHLNFNKILKGNYNNAEYITTSTLRVGWESEKSPFNKEFDKTFLKRIRAYDNNGHDFDIEMNFKMLENNRYISDGDKTSIVIPKDKENKVNNPYNLKVITY
ncbi:MAG: polysaccharide deacetylase family protein [Bacilli bacterium]